MSDDKELVVDRYPKEDLTVPTVDPDYGYSVDGRDDGTMADSRDNLAKAVIGHKIVDVRRGNFKAHDDWYSQSGLALLLDNGHIVWAAEEGDCCAFTEVKTDSIIKHLDKIDHVITGVGTTDGYEKWHIYADLGDVLEFTVDWSGGNLGYYGFGFTISVFEPNQQGSIEAFKELESGS